MGCDIHMHAERKNGEGKWVYVETENLYENRGYALFGWLAGVRNYSAVTPLALPRGLPLDASAKTQAAYDAWSSDAHTPHWYTLDELLAVDYEQPVEDRRCMRNGNGGSTCEAGGGTVQTLREFIGHWFIDSLPLLKADGVERIVFWFDN